MMKYNIRYYPYRDSIVIPVYNRNGDLCGIRTRNMNPNNDIKYMPLETMYGEQYNFPTNMIFYGENFNESEIRRTKKVILVEGEKSVLKSDTWFGSKSIALGMMGSNLGEHRLKYLISLGVEEVTIMIDSDFLIAGDNDEYNRFEDKVFKLYDILSPYFKVYVCYNNLGYTDMYKSNPFDFDLDRYNKLWESRELIND